MIKDVRFTWLNIYGAYFISIKKAGIWLPPLYPRQNVNKSSSSNLFDLEKLQILRTHSWEIYCYFPTSFAVDNTSEVT
jgi:hypothetical protein